MRIWPFENSNSGGAYHALPLSGSNPLYASRQSWRQLIQKPRIVVGAVAGLVLLLTLYGVSSSSFDAPTRPSPTNDSSTAPKPTLPPLFRELKEVEARLPQHNLSLPFPEGKNGRYFFDANTLWNVGFNNVLDNLILDTHLAYLSNRAYVFNEYTWDVTDKPYVMKHGHLAPAKLPLTTYLSGPTAGGSWGPGKTAPRSVSLEFFNRVCPENERLIINGTEERIRMDINEGTSTELIMMRWAERLKSIEERCVQINGWERRVFDYEEFGSAKTLSLWPSLSASPTVKRFAWSETVIAGVNQGLRLLSQPDDRPAPPSNVIKGLLAVHIRRGDYSFHCDILGKSGKTYWQWNLLPDMVDKYTPHPDAWKSNTTESVRTRQEHMDHCYPSLGYILRRIETVLRDDPSKSIRKVFILTNADAAFVRLLKDAIKESLRIDAFSSATEDLGLDERARGAQPGVDMEIAARADIFLGNGFSSLTTNVNLLRLTRGLPFSTIRFW